jgi:hypothetical protein
MRVAAQAPPDADRQPSDDQRYRKALHCGRRLQLTEEQVPSSRAPGRSSVEAAGLLGSAEAETASTQKARHRATISLVRTVRAKVELTLPL